MSTNKENYSRISTKISALFLYKKHPLHLIFQPGNNPRTRKTMSIIYKTHKNTVLFLCIFNFTIYLYCAILIVSNCS